jgi:hypothetical protein
VLLQRLADLGRDVPGVARDRGREVGEFQLDPQVCGHCRVDAVHPGAGGCLDRALDVFAYALLADVHDLGHEIVPGAEVVVDRRRADAGRLGDVAEPGLPVALLGQQRGGAAQQSLACALLRSGAGLAAGTSVTVPGHRQGIV